tara:strand:+ start:12315 stop:12902 length:588 start_codon:yes stop_codon:yes gene_type:complete
MMFLIQEPTVNAYKTFFYNGYMVEIFGGVVLSVMTILLIWFLRPRVRIAGKISKTTDKDGDVAYVFKVMNKSRIFQLVDIKFELTKLTPNTTPHGMNIDIVTVPLRSSHIWFLSRRKKKSKSNGDFATYAVLISPEKGYELEKEWKIERSSFYDLKVIAKNNFSGITSIMHKKFSHSKSSIKDGEFCHGNSLDIE